MIKYTSTEDSYNQTIARIGSTSKEWVKFQKKYMKMNLAVLILSTSTLICIILGVIGVIFNWQIYILAFLFVYSAFAIISYKYLIYTSKNEASELSNIYLSPYNLLYCPSLEINDTALKIEYYDRSILNLQKRRTGENTLLEAAKMTYTIDLNKIERVEFNTFNTTCLICGDGAISEYGGMSCTCKDFKFPICFIEKDADWQLKELFDSKM